MEDTLKESEVKEETEEREEDSPVYHDISQDEQPDADQA